MYTHTHTLTLTLGQIHFYTETRTQTSDHSHTERYLDPDTASDTPGEQRPGCLPDQPCSDRLPGQAHSAVERSCASPLAQDLVDI